MTLRPASLLASLAAALGCAPLFGQGYGADYDEPPRRPMAAQQLVVPAGGFAANQYPPQPAGVRQVLPVQFTQPVPNPQPAAPPGAFFGPPPANSVQPNFVPGPNGLPVPGASPPAAGFIEQPAGPPPSYVPGSMVAPLDSVNLPPPTAFPGFPHDQPPGGASSYFGLETPTPGTPTDLEIILQEAQTGRLMIGAGINSNAGLVGNIVIDERNFDWTRFPRSFEDFADGTAFRGAGQGFRLEAMPGTQVQRYTASFTEPYLFNTAVSMQLSAFYFTRNYFDWSEDRVGGRMQFGYRLTQDLTVAVAGRYENVDVYDPRTNTVPILNEAVGNNDLAGARISITHDTRDHVFTPSEGYYVQLSYEQVFGTWDYPQGEIDIRRYFLLSERADGSGRHTLGWSNRLGVSGSQTPIYENYFAGGYSTLRGFDFRGASPKEDGVIVGGRMQFLGSVEYMFPITHDDMLKGIIFCDYGTVERDLAIESDNFRVALGAGLRINVPAMGPAPIALDFASPLAHADGDNIQIFSFFIGINR